MANPFHKMRDAHVKHVKSDSVQARLNERELLVDFNDNDVFTVCDLAFGYPKHNVFNGISFTIPKGKVTTLMGANGCGKSTLFYLMTKNLRPDTGEIFLHGQDIDMYRLNDFAREVAIVHQYNTAPYDVTVEALVGYGRTPYRRMYQGMSKEDDIAVDEAIEICDLNEYRNKRVSELSGGQQQRVWIAMALAQKTKTLFLDEPTTYLDVKYQYKVLKLIERLNRELGLTIVMIIHDINQALQFSDEILALRDGRIVAQGPAEEVITREVIDDVYQTNFDVRLIDGKKFVLMQ